MALIMFVVELSDRTVSEVTADVIYCPNSGVTCKVTQSDGFIVESEKGKNDGSVILTNSK